MLRELEIRDFAIIDCIGYRLLPGLNVLTGETGAGKSIIVDALGLLLGARADSGSVRAGCDRAVVQGVFSLGGVSERLAEVLTEFGVPEDEDLLLSREVHVEGRSTARINGRVVPVRALVEVGRLLVDNHGQGESASLLREAEHLELLDRFAGLVPDRTVMREVVHSLRDLRSELAALTADSEARARRAELLAWQVAEIESARPVPGEDAELASERSRLTNVERLAQLADSAYAALRDAGDGREGALDCLSRAGAALDALIRIDSALAPLAESVSVAIDQLSDLSSRLLDYRDRLEFDAPRLEEIESRLALLGDLRRKYGADLAAVLEYARRAGLELQGLTGGEQRAAELRSRSEALELEVGRLAGRLSLARAEAAARLSAAVVEELAALGMPGSRFEVELEQADSDDGVPVGDHRLAFGPNGVDTVSFRVSANPGEPVRPLVAVSSGGETARIMLGLKSVLQAADRVPVLVFDEIDAGIGGRIGAVVGRRLWLLAANRQVLCVTHLPQVAVFGDVHWHVRKESSDGRTVTVLVRLDAADRVNEIAQMLGTVSPSGRNSAMQLLQETEAWKARHRDGESGARRV